MQITIQTQATNPVDLKAIEKKLTVIAQLPADDLDRLFQIAENPKALTALKSKWTMLKMMF
ncbi:hypothetical protein [Flavobacterium cerinum]|uniref:Uncharacterized protein n=1 Tax=Flavobacterium cerinum TaxID=2502784 RepID=A0ABY5ITC0_9FLAO|nr:hypothetical protein [Flavobacterium cerinum]UUC45581.1 hypothetical protein NOX80_18415 [Flavobacterium cerinum]